MMNRGSRRLLVVAAVATVLLAFAAPTLALSFGLRDAADRSSVVPIREMDLAAILSGEGDPNGAWAEAALKLSDRCKDPEILDRKDCDDSLRCGWLGARVAVARAFTGQTVRGEMHAAAFLSRAADRLAVGGVCGRSEKSQQRWEHDRQQAAEDDALVQLALLVRAADAIDGPLMEPARQRAVMWWLERAQQEGLAGINAAELAPLRGDLSIVVARATWLRKHPVIARIRRTLPRLWEDVGGIPEGCGRDLLRPDLLDDQWRGYLVREVIAEALLCAAERLPAALERKGLRLRDREAAEIAARSLSSLAARDRGGRAFADDDELFARVGEVEKLLTPSAAARAASPPKRRGPSARTGRKTKPKAQASAAPRSGTSKRGRGGRSAPRRGSPDQELVRLARDVEGVLAQGGELSRAARQARTGSERERVLDRLVVASHRSLCAPLEEVSLEDLEAARRILVERGHRTDEEVCRATAGAESLERLLAASDSLRILAAAAQLRRAARLIGEGDIATARQVLAALPEERRGTTWILLTAWAAREDGDHVTAERTLALLDEETLDRLRASGSEAVARIVAHAWVSRAP